MRYACRSYSHFSPRGPVETDRRYTLSGKDNTHTMTHNVGTLLWSAPEVLKGLPYNKNVDVYR